MPAEDFIPADHAGVTVNSDAYGKFTVNRVFLRKDRTGKLVVELEPVTSGRSFGAATRCASNEIELLCKDATRRRIVLKQPEVGKLAVDR